MTKILFLSLLVVALATADRTYSPPTRSFQSGSGFQSQFSSAPQTQQQQQQQFRIKESEERFSKFDSGERFSQGGGDRFAHGGGLSQGGSRFSQGGGVELSEVRGGGGGFAQGGGFSQGGSRFTQGGGFSQGGAGGFRQSQHQAFSKDSNERFSSSGEKFSGHSSGEHSGGFSQGPTRDFGSSGISGGARLGSGEHPGDGGSRLRGQTNQQFGSGFGGQSSGFSGQSSGFGGQSSGFGGQSSGFGGQSSGFGGPSIPAPIIAILRDDREDPVGGSYSFIFESEDGIRRQESGSPTGPDGSVVQQGSWSFTYPDGTPAEFTFIADENGYQVDSNLLPTPHPLPAHAVAQIEKAERERAAGIIHDGQYREEDHLGGGLGGGFQQGSRSGGYQQGSISGGFQQGSRSGGFQQGSISGGFQQGGISSSSQRGRFPSSGLGQSQILSSGFDDSSSEKFGSSGLRQGSSRFQSSSESDDDRTHFGGGLIDTRIGSSSRIGFRQGQQGQQGYN